jgi:hypothetical protein
MEQFFTPTQRLQDRRDIFDESLGYTEVQLAVSIEAFMNHSWDWSNFYAFVKGDEGEMWKILWIAEDTFIFVEDENNRLEYDLHDDYEIEQRAKFTAPSGETHELVLALDQESSSLPAGASSLFWHALAANNFLKLQLELMSDCFELCYGPDLLRFLEASPPLELLEFDNFHFEEAQCRALATLERTDLEVTFRDCCFDAQGAKDTFIEWLRHSQVVTKLESCMMDGNILL